jgi:hypothetical protein
MWVVMEDQVGLVAVVVVENMVAGGGMVVKV